MKFYTIFMRIESCPLLIFVVMMIILIIKIARLKKLGIRSKRLKITGSHSKFHFGVVFGLLFLIWLLEIIRSAFDLDLSLLPKWSNTSLLHVEVLQFAGVILILLGLIVFGITLVNFGTSVRFGLDENNRGKLITTGIFSLSRNPFFLSLDLYFLGVAMILPNAFMLVFAIAALVGIHFFILKEERFLHKNYGEEYQNYRHKTRRYL